jgi:hypothetical protein
VGDEDDKKWLRQYVAMWTETFDNPVEVQQTEFLMRQIPQEEHVPAVLQFYDETIRPLVIEVRRDLVSRLRSLFLPLLQACRGVELNVLHLMLKHLQPCTNIVQLFISNAPAQAQLTYRRVFMGIGNASQIFVSDEAAIAWKKADVSERMLTLSCMSEVVTGIKCDITEFAEVTGFNLESKSAMLSNIDKSNFNSY